MLAALQPRRSASRARPPNTTPREVEDATVWIRKELGDRGLDHGPVTVRYYLRQQGFAPVPAASTLARISSRRGMVQPRPAKRPRSSYRPFTASAVHETWQLDGVAVPTAVEGAFVVLQLIDDRSRFSLAPSFVYLNIVLSLADQAKRSPQRFRPLLTRNQDGPGSKGANVLAGHS